MPRYVILRHELPPSDARGLHWDLMLEHGPALRTWALETEPFTAEPIRATRLADHRLAYLEYEGPVSQNRGTVERVDAGRYEVIEDGETVLSVVLSDGRWHGPLRLEKANDHLWIVSFSRAPVSD